MVSVALIRESVLCKCAVSGAAILSFFNRVESTAGGASASFRKKDPVPLQFTRNPTTNAMITGTILIFFY
ncbi:hypothetical protein NIASO_05285 [Niabella soli DSM 19437]|uniref:Uncharacterized protein n=1 Tax=Niabella soli DSM 19437 TaxID=929713 RepID=W0F2P8_9BACT|nr:hypothetical protein NIASO_05285 [Niabella soli DSM 19437]